MSEASGRHWFEDVADHLGVAYLRYSFTKGTRAEVDSLVGLLGLGAGSRVLDVGCGPGRHALELAARGVEVFGVDISETFVGLARAAAVEAGVDGLASFEVLDARRLEDHSDLLGAFDAVISLCQGAFGLSGGPGAERVPGRELDEAILSGMAAALRPEGRLGLSAFSAYFQLKYLGEGNDFEAGDGVNREDTVIRSPDGDEEPTELWTTCYTPRELRLLARAVGLVPMDVYGVTPGAYRPGLATIEVPEFLLIAEKTATAPGPAEPRTDEGP